MKRTWTSDELVEAFVRHQRRTRGTCEHALRQYGRSVAEFLGGVFGDGTIDLGRVNASDVVQFVSSRTAQYRARTVKQIGTALRHFFRFLRATGLSDGRLDEAVPTVAHWRLSTLPRSLTEEQHRKLLSSLSEATPCARRDRAMILCLSALGLRAGELAALEIEDIDWRRATLRVRTRKTGRGAVLPWPKAAGVATAAYLRKARPQTQDRHVFVTHGRGVGRAVSGSLVARVVDTALRRAGIDAPTRGAHLLRHTLATRLVRSGTRLEEIACVLGHRSLETTAIYAKVDVTSLAGVALPWPAVTP